VIAADFPEGMRPCDNHEVSQLNELKVDLEALTFVAHYRMNGNIVMCEQMPILGGWAGGLEETTIVGTATHLNSPVLVGADWHLDGPTHVRWGITTARETLLIAGHINRAIEKHTHLLTGNQYYTAAGPCTEMCLLEAAGQAVTDTASGREIMSGCASAKGTVLDRTTPIEARMMAYAARAVAGMETERVNHLLDKLVTHYEGTGPKRNFNTAPIGKTFQECFDVVTLKPTAEHLQVLGQAMKTMEQIGFEFKL
jgi:methylamine--corrinoid protein Co-methyltransferase